MTRRTDPHSPAAPPRTRRLTAIVRAALLFGTAGGLMACSGEPDRTTDNAAAGSVSEGASPAEARPATRTDTLLIEGVQEPVQAQLFEAEDFPLPFSTYVPADMATELDESERTAHFTAEFGGVRNEDTFVHVYVFPEGTDNQEALALAKGYKSGRGIPVSRGIEIIADELRPPRMDWALKAYRFRYEDHNGWYGGTIGVGLHDGRPFMIVRHYPLEYEEGFQPRADLITRNWQWGDGTGLHLSPPEPPPIVEGIN